MDMKLADPKGLIRESYKIEGITPEECRSIFVDWALSLGADIDVKDAMRAAMAGYNGAVDHPMSVVLTQGMLATEQTPKRRGGRAAKFQN